MKLKNIRPMTRAECEKAWRPCPWVSCRHHLMLDVSADGRKVRLNFEDIDDMKETCSLDVADGGPSTQYEVAALLNITRQRVCVIENVAILRRRVMGRKLL